MTLHNKRDIIITSLLFYVRTYVRTYIRTYARTHARTHVRTYVRTHTHKQINEKFSTFKFRLGDRERTPANDCLEVITLGCQEADSTNAVQWTVICMPLHLLNLLLDQPRVITQLQTEPQAVFFHFVFLMSNL